MKNIHHPPVRPVSSVTGVIGDVEINANAKPFLKWAGGKTQLLSELERRLPDSIKKQKKIERYVEPFVGGGALFFYLKKEYELEQTFLCDINRELIIGYKVIQNNPKELIDILEEFEYKYLEKTEKWRENFYYEIRENYNKQIMNFNYKNYNKEWIKRTTFLIFLNKTCFNGLFRQNRSGEFNVPFGRYKNPTICDKKNIIEVNKALENVVILCDDFTATEKYINEKTFVYLDPPYRPISNTSSFTSYYKENFSDKDQIRLANFYKEMNHRKTHLMLSNSDSLDNFFQNLYNNFNIKKVLANRMINCNGNRRGKVTELIITNY